MTTAVDKIFTWSFSILMLVATALGAWLQEYYIIAIPPGIVACIFLLQYPAYLFYALVLAIPWSIEYNFTPSIGTDLPDEPLMLLMAAASVLLIIINRKKLDRFRHPLVFILLVQLTWAGITVINSTDPLVSLKFLLAKGWYLLAFVAAPLYLFTDEKILKRSFALLLFSMMAFMVYAMFRHSENNWTFEKINDSLEPFYRNHVNYSALLVFMVPIQIAVIQLSNSRLLKLIMQCLLVVTVIALYFSYSRGAWLALIGGAIAYWLIRKKLLFAGYMFFIIGCLVAVLWLRSGDRYLDYSPHYQTTIFHTNFKEHLVATYQMRDVSTAERFYRWVAGVNMVEDSWKTGFGPTSFFREYKAYAIPAFKTWVSKNEEQSTVHNYFLLLIIEQGLVGLLLFVLLLGMMFWYAQKIYHSTNNHTWKVIMAAIGAILIMQCAVNSLSDLVETDKVGSVFYLCLSVLIIGGGKVHSPWSMVHGRS